MNRDIPVQVAYDRTNKGVDVRNSSTANFLIDSQDRVSYNQSTTRGANLSGTTSADFQITKLGQNLLSGFFTRIAMTEIVLTWNIFNISSAIGNNATSILVLDIATGTRTTTPVSIIGGNYTVKTALDAFLVAINSATGLVFTLVDSATVANGFAGKKAIQAPAGYNFVFQRTTVIPDSPAPFQLDLAQALGFDVYRAGAFIPNPSLRQAVIASKPNLLPYDYIDITSSQLASQQKVKDATTSAFDSIDVIYRWNFAGDESYPVEYDAYGYQIIPGYLPFTAKRYLSFPKQVRWDPIVPIGNLSFQTYTDQETLLSYSTLYESFDFKMLMLISEV